MTTRSFLPAPVLPALLPALLLAGCAGGTRNRGLESIHQPVVSRSDYALDLQTVRRSLARGESQRLAGWLSSMRIGYGDRIAVDDPAGDAGPAHDEVGAVVASFGLLLADAPPVTAAAVTPGTIRVVVSRMRASVPGCPDWSRDVSHDFDQHTSSNHGCGINSNLAAMIANPADLIGGQSNGEGVDPVTNTRAIEAYRKQAPTGATGLPGGVSSVSVVKGN